MEILAFNVTLCYHVGNFGSKLVDKNSISCKPGIFTRKKTKLLFLRNDHGSGLLRFSVNHKFLEYPNRIEGSFNAFKVGDFKVSSSKFDGYVINADEDVETISESGESTTKVLIPGLPDDSSSAVIDSCFWEWKPKLYVHYEKAGSDSVKSPPVLFLPGFGVGSFHYKNQLKDLGREHRVWALDFLGQGMSLPTENPTSLSREGDELEVNSLWGFGDETEPWANELVYSIDLWQEQVRYFVEEVIGEPVYVTGNSLGGYVALYFAANYPHLVKGITLLNATPFWGFLPNPTRSPGLARIFPWSGTFPFPANVRKITEFLWQKISDPKSIAQVLRQVYADHSTNVDQVFSRILEITEHPAAAASFASIMCAPQGQLSFGECLMRCRMNNLPICLMYGKEDPWVKPIWGLQVKRQVPEAAYYEISPAGHCPHDEVPEVVNYLIRGWIKNIESSGSVSLPLLNDSESIKQHNICRELEFPREGSKKSVNVRFFGSTFSLWERIRSALKSRISNSETVSS